MSVIDYVVYVCAGFLLVLTAINTGNGLVLIEQGKRSAGTYAKGLIGSGLVVVVSGRVFGWW